MFRRRTDSATKDPADEPQPPEKPQGKGRPTPKRREAEKRRRQPITAPRTRKEAYGKTRERQREERRRAKEGMSRGEENYLPKRDRGPARRLARDYVDSRRTLAEYLMYLVLLIVVAGVVAPLEIKVVVSNFGIPVLFVLALIESLRLRNGVLKLVRERHPDESVRGLGIYTAMRALSIRRMRMPQPRLKPGQKNEV